MICHDYNVWYSDNNVLKIILILSPINETRLAVRGLIDNKVTISKSIEIDFLKSTLKLQKMALVVLIFVKDLIAARLQTFALKYYGMKAKE